MGVDEVALRYQSGLQMSKTNLQFELFAPTCQATDDIDSLFRGRLRRDFGLNARSMLASSVAAKGSVVPLLA